MSCWLLQPGSVDDFVLHEYCLAVMLLAVEFLVFTPSFSPLQSSVILEPVAESCPNPDSPFDC